MKQIVFILLLYVAALTLCSTASAQGLSHKSQWDQVQQTVQTTGWMEGLGCGLGIRAYCWAAGATAGIAALNGIEAASDQINWSYQSAIEDTIDGDLDYYYSTAKDWSPQQIMEYELCEENYYGGCD